MQIQIRCILCTLLLGLILLFGTAYNLCVKSVYIYIYIYIYFYLSDNHSKYSVKTVYKGPVATVEVRKKGRVECAFVIRKGRGQK